MRFAPLAALSVLVLLVAAAGAQDPGSEPFIGEVTPTKAPTVGGISITLRGTNFGAVPGLVTVQGSTASDIDAWSDTLVVLRVPAGEPGFADIILSHDGGLSDTTSLFGYELPSVTGLDPASGPHTGGVPITVVGTNFGTGSSGTVLMGGTVITLTGSGWGHTRIECVTAPGEGEVDVEVHSNGTVSNASSYAYQGTVAAVEPAGGPTAGGTVITVVGSGFGGNPGSIEVGENPGGAVTWSDTQIVATTPEGYSGPKDVVVTSTEGTVSTGTDAFAYDAPQITEGPADLPTVAGCCITIHGENFGTQAAPRTVSVGGTPVGEVAYNGHQEIVTEYPDGIPGEPTEIEVEVVQLTDAWPTKWKPFEILSLSPATGPETGGSIITIHGSEFGGDPALSRTVIFGGAPASDVTWVSGVMLLCVAPPHPAGPVDVVLEIAAASDTLPGAYTYGTASGAGDPVLPAAFAFPPARPNPFTAQTVIRMDFPADSDYVLGLYDVRGRLVHRFAGHAAAGRLFHRWDGTASSGAPVADGIYFARMQAGNFQAVQRLIRLQ
jgi:hypothetical protein